MTEYEADLAAFGHEVEKDLGGFRRQLDADLLIAGRWLTEDLEALRAALPLGPHGPAGLAPLGHGHPPRAQAPPSAPGGRVAGRGGGMTLRPGVGSIRMASRRADSAWRTGASVPAARHLALRLLKVALLGGAVAIAALHGLVAALAFATTALAHAWSEVTRAMADARPAAAWLLLAVLIVPAVASEDVRRCCCCRRGGWWD